MATSHFHINRLTEQLVREISTIIAQEMRDPRIPPVVTVTRIKLAQDTRDATVFISVFGDADVKTEAIKALNAAAAYIQRTAASRIVVKNFPHLYFKIDNSLEHTMHINELLKEVKDDLGQP